MLAAMWVVDVRIFKLRKWSRAPYQLRAPPKNSCSVVFIFRKLVFSQKHLVCIDHCHTAIAFSANGIVQKAL